MSMILPTPPRTAYKDKENLPPTPLTPNSSPNFRTPRIVWSQENLHHAYTNQIRLLPSSRRAKEPSKSILKKVSLPLMSLMPPEQPSREVTPEPADPLHHPLYLNSPVATLVTSLLPGGDAKISLTDLTEAYSLLSARLKTKTHAMLDMCGPIPALEPLREHADKLVVAFHRDIQRAFINPQGSPSPSEPSPWSSPSSAGSVQKRGYTEQEVKHARDLCNLSHAALRCFSNISVVPVLCSIFSDPQLGEILTDVLAIPLAPSLPTPNARKTCQIAVWTLQVQRLPTAVLVPAADRIAYALRRGIDGELGREGKKGAISDGLKAVAMLASYQPAIFLTPLAEILPSVLVHLTSQNLALRVQAAHAILSLSHALAYLPAPPQTLRATFSQAISNYLTEQHQTRKTPQDVSPLGKAFRVCLEADVPVHAAQSPMWALSVTAAVIALSGGNAFTDARTLKFVLGHIQSAMAVKRTTVRATAGLVWRALVWACVKLDDSEQHQEHKDAGWKVVRQVLDGNIGISVIAALIGQKARKDGRVPQALELVRTMIKKGGRTCEEAVNVLERLLSGVGSGVEEQQEKEWADEKLLVEPLFNGTLLQAEWKGVVAHVKDALGRCVVVSDVRPLHEDEVTEHWDVLFAIWKDGVERAPLGEDGEVPSALLGAWQALLLTQAQLTQGYEHLTSAPAFVSHLTGLLKSFLTDQSLEWSLDAGAPSWSSQSLKLGFVRNLWSVARNVFAAPTLAGAAQTLLYEVLKHEYLLGQIEVREAWAALCAELVLAGVPGLVRELWQLQDQAPEKEVKRGLWRVVSQRWLEDAGSSDGAIELLRAPFVTPINWEFNQDDLELWVRLVNCALLAASVRKVSPTTVLDAIAGEIGVDHNRPSLYAALPHLLSGVDVSALGRRAEPRYPYVLLTLTNDVLAANYPPPGAGDKPMLLSVMECLTEIVKTLCGEMLIQFLAQVQNGARLWIQDEKGVLTDEEYNQQVIPFYATSLEALKAVPPSLESLCILTPLLVSAFNRIPAPATGPSAFQNFWTEVYPQLGKLEGRFPEELKPIVRSVQETMCVEEVVSSHGLSLETQTQDQEPAELQFVIPDSLEGDEPELSDNVTLRGILDALCEESEIRGPQNGNDQPSVNIADFSLREEKDVVSNLQKNNSAGSHWPRSTSREASQGAPEVSRRVPAERDNVLSQAPSHVSESQTSAVSNHGLAAHQSVPSQLARAQDNLVTSNRLGYDVPFVGNDPKGPQPGPNLTASAVDQPSATLSSAAMSSPQSVKKEDLDIDPDMAMILESSQDSILSQPKSSGSPLGKRRRSRILSQSNKKRRTAPHPGVEIINISDDEDSEQVALDVSIVVAPIKRQKSLETQYATALRGCGQPSTSKSIPQFSTASSTRKKRTLFEAVELPRMAAHRNVSIGSSPDSSPCKRRTITRTQSTSKLWCPKSEPDMASQSPSKRRRISDLSGKGKQKAIDDWSGEIPVWSTFNAPSAALDPASDNADMQETPMQFSDVSIPSSKPGQISASYITSPLLRRSRSEAYDPPSDDMPASSSPLKQAMARRRLQRARTAPVVLGEAVDSDTIPRARPQMARTPSEEFLALEHAHVVVTSGASKMELLELLDASKMVNQISGALGDEMTRKLGGR